MQGEKMRALQKRISLFSPIYCVKYLFKCLFLRFSLFPPKECPSHMRHYLSISRIYFLLLLPRLSQMNIYHRGIRTLFGPSWETAFMEDTVAFYHENVYSATYSRIMTSIKKGKKITQTGYEEHLFIWTRLGSAVWAWEPTIYCRQKDRHLERRRRNETWKVTF